MDSPETLIRRRLFTWLDVQGQFQLARASNLWPSWLFNISAYPDGISIAARNGASENDVSELLKSWFGARYQKEAGIVLESLPDQPRSLAVALDHIDSEATAPNYDVEPTFKRVSLIPAQADQTFLPPPFPSGTPPLVAFYSFKGGVGRTTHLIALLNFLSKQGVKTLVVDADLEAPGITSLVNSDRTSLSSPFSFIDLLALAHADDSPNWQTTLDLAAYEIARNTLTLSSESLSAEQFFLPAYRDIDQTLTLDIRPEHLINAKGAEWNIGNLFGALGKRLSVGAVLIDLRAGLSELSSPFLLDPRIRRVIVSTPASQSIEGTAIVLRQLSKIAPPSLLPGVLVEREDIFDPIVFISFVTQDFSTSGQLVGLTQKLISSYPDFSDDVTVARLQVRDTAFSQELLYLSSFKDAVNRIDASGLSRDVATVAEDFVSIANSYPSGAQPVPADQLRTRLSDVAKRLEYAESGKGDRFLAISPLRLLANHFRNEPPVAVVVGAKGSGKTFTCLQLVRAKDWSNFVNIALGESGSTIHANIWPFLQSKNLEKSAKDLVQGCKDKTIADMSLRNAGLSSLQTEDEIRKSLQHQTADVTWWRHRWFKLIADSLGISSTPDNAAAGSLIEFLRSKRQRLVVIIDGLEDLFPALERQEAQQVALRALLQEVPAYLNEIPNSPLGIVIFVRADLVSAAISQNEGQFKRLYEAYALRWNEEEALRLAAWTAIEAGMNLGLPKNRKLETITAEEARKALIPVWGWKLGADTSREARTAEWVIAALSDFRGQIQARDLVRLFRYAAEKSRGNLLDRVLVPRAIRDAIQPCSEEKIKEIKQEIPPLKQIFAKLQDSTQRKIPFDAPSSGLAVEEIRFLESTGVLIEDKGEYFMPEIFRLGLGFQLERGARPRVLSLARRAVSKQLPQ
jgi:cellulose biosynthesis protein BcsQ